MVKFIFMYFYVWKSGLKIGMYYLRMKSVVDVIKFILNNEIKKEFVEVIVEIKVEVVFVVLEKFLIVKELKDLLV